MAKDVEKFERLLSEFGRAYTCSIYSKDKHAWRKTSDYLKEKLIQMYLNSDVEEIEEAILIETKEE